jgi:outer membrane protein assembly factor BamE (lipoprotein component of BamABCDE complex)
MKRSAMVLALVLGSTAPAFAAAATIQPGMTKDEVRQLLGRPEATMKFPRSHTESWDYGHGYHAGYSVTFGPDGRVSGTISEPSEG